MVAITIVGGYAWLGLGEPPVKIVKKSSLGARHFEAARLSNFATASLVSSGQDGTLLGAVSEEFILGGLLGLSPDSVIIIGVESANDGIVVQKREITDEMVEGFLSRHLATVPGLKSVEYCHQHIDDGEVVIAVLTWDWYTQYRIREALGATFTPIAWNMLLGEQRGAECARSYSADALSKYREHRKLVSPNAVELRYDVDHLPSLLGLDGDKLTTSASVAAFGRNGGVCAAVYIRADKGQFSPAALNNFTRGTDKKGQKSITDLRSNDKDPADGATHRLSATPYSLGRDVFEISQNAHQHICTADEIFGDGTPVGEFEPGLLASAVRELIVNAFCHGAWGAQEVGRDDNEQMEANRIAIVHAGNRIEVINRLRETGLIQNAFGTEKPPNRRSALHNAFVDINFAYGRNVGLRLVRQRLSRIGLPSPLFIRGYGHYRAVIPISFATPGWCVLTERRKDFQERLLQFYTLHLARLLLELDEDLLASALYVRKVEASRVLSQLEEMGALARVDPPRFLGKQSLHRYEVSEIGTVSELIDQLSEGMIFYPAVPQISLGGQYQLSNRSMALLTDDDLRSYIQGLYNWELANPSEAVRLTTSHMNILSGVDSVRLRFARD